MLRWSRYVVHREYHRSSRDLFWGPSLAFRVVPFTGPANDVYTRRTPHPTESKHNSVNCHGCPSRYAVPFLSFVPTMSTICTMCTMCRLFCRSATSFATTESTLTSARNTPRRYDTPFVAICIVLCGLPFPGLRVVLP